MSLINQDDVIVVGQNILGYDLYMLGVIARNLNIKVDYSFAKRCFDTEAIATAIAKDNKNPDKKDFLAWQLRYLNYWRRVKRTCG